MSDYVLGLDWINQKQGWACARCDMNAPGQMVFSTLLVEEAIEPLVKDAACIVVDSPIGLYGLQPEGCKIRPCDQGARQWVGPGMQSSIFAVPYENELTLWRQRRLEGSPQKQGHFRGLLPMIHSADCIRRQNPRTLESHPELTFAALGCGKLSGYASKKTLLGQLLRVAILHQQGYSLDLRDLIPFARIPSDNFIDATAMAIVACGWYRDGKLPVIREQSGDPVIHTSHDRDDFLIALPKCFSDSRELPPLTSEQIMHQIQLWGRSIGTAT